MSIAGHVSRFNEIAERQWAAEEERSSHLMRQTGISEPAGPPPAYLRSKR
jgi:hypothetical protein